MVFEPYDDDFSDSIPEESILDEESLLPADIAYEVSLYLKVGLFCGWSWQEFQDTPILIREAISMEIDNRLKPYIEGMEASARKSGKAGKGLLPLNFFHLSLLLALSTMLGGDE